MELPFPTNGPEQLLPHGGTATYFHRIFERDAADELFIRLLHGIDWRNDKVRLYGKTIITKRKVAWYAEQAFVYRYSGSDKIALPWTGELVRIKSTVEHVTGHFFNSCLLNLYHSGEEGMSWHSDDEDSLAPDAPIASVSFGVARKFSFRVKSSKETRSVWLSHGSLLLMDAASQRNWQHALPKSKRIQEPRINLTFRRMR